MKLFLKSPGFPGKLWLCALLALLFMAGCAADEDRKAAWQQGLSDGKKPWGLARMFRGGSETAVSGRAGRGQRPYLKPGNDRFINETLRDIPGGAMREEDGVLINFEDAELRDAVAAILGKILNLNYYYDPRVQGRVTLQTVAPLSDQDTIAALELILRQNGGALVKRDGIYAVVPAAEAGSRPQVPTLADGGVSLTPGYAVMIARMQHASASELAGVLEPLAGPQTTVRFDANRNVLILSGSAADLSSLRETIGMFDVDWLDGLSYGLFPLRNARAGDLVKELEAILGGPNSPVRDQVTLEPVQRMNAVLAVTKRRRILEEIRGWVGRLDQESGAATDGVYVYRVENIPAKDLADALTQVFGRSGNRIGGSAVSANAETVSVSSDGEPQAQPVGVPLDLGAPGEDVRVFANEVNNTLVVRALPDTYERIVAVIKQLDVAPLQVLIDATIAEVSLTNQLNYGVQFYLNKARGSLISTTGSTKAVSAALPGFAASYVAGGAEVVLSALDSVTRLNVISTPRIMVLDNQSATLNVGNEVPVITQQQQSSSGESNLVNQVTYRETGITLKVKPRVSPSGLVTLEISQETSNVVQDDSAGTLTPTISQRTIQSAIAVQNGQTVLLGGLIQESDSRAKTGVPVLSDTPILGNLFGSRRNGSDRTELIVMLTPRVVRDPNEVRDVTQELRRRIQALAPEFAPRNSLTKLRKKKR